MTNESARGVGEQKWNKSTLTTMGLNSSTLRGFSPPLWGWGQLPVTQLWKEDHGVFKGTFALNDAIIHAQFKNQ